MHPRIRIIRVVGWLSVLEIDGIATLRTCNLRLHHCEMLVAMQCGMQPGTSYQRRHYGRDQRT